MPRKKKPYTYLEREDLGVTYVYANEDVWDDNAQKNVRKRRLIGKLDPDTKEIVPTEGRGGYHGKKTVKEKPSQPAPADAALKASTTEESGDSEPSSLAKLRERLEEEKAASVEFRKAANTRIRELNLKIDQLTVSNEEYQRRYEELRSRVAVCVADLSAITKEEQ